jgi:hypothetical protein
LQELFETFSRTLGDGHPFWLLPLHSGATSEEQERIFQPAPCGQRKVILATNIAESSITVPDVKYVVDFGFIKEIFYDAKTNLVRRLSIAILNRNRIGISSITMDKQSERESESWTRWQSESWCSISAVQKDLLGRGDE